MAIKTGIVGGAGYTAGELIRVLIGHPDTEIEWILSNSHAGEPITKVHADLLGESSMTFSKTPDFNSVDLIFLCMGHGKSKSFIEEHSIPEKVKIIDLSHDYRIKASGNDFVYGLTELNHKEIAKANKIANPGCFATAVQLAILPLAKAGVLNEIHTHAITGSTGAGQAPSPTTHFSWRDNNISTYNAFTHRHLKEVYQSINEYTPSYDKDVNFIPMRGDFTRGILASVYSNCDLSQNQITELFKDYYKESPFTIITDTNPDLKQVVNTNKCFIYPVKYKNKVHIVSIIDNLLKGASGQAVENMNLMFNLPWTKGLYLKPSAF
ncbi:N-acetyl-gamma-glutamyl-phosphate reductase [Marinilabiliaceae bacterium ANBcel2]|nr:N-acetyl-gamma-glutamyl-phosphate reductase [Marinilabiliaceae bacterium ANBcel2]